MFRTSASLSDRVVGVPGDGKTKKLGKGRGSVKRKINSPSAERSRSVGGNARKEKEIQEKINRTQNKSLKHFNCDIPHFGFAQ
jgi:hypothetical protein